MRSTIYIYTAAAAAKKKICFRKTQEAFLCFQKEQKKQASSSNTHDVALFLVVLWPKPKRQIVARRTHTRASNDSSNFGDIVRQSTNCN